MLIDWICKRCGTTCVSEIIETAPNDCDCTCCRVVTVIGPFHNIERYMAQVEAERSE